MHTEIFAHSLSTPLPTPPTHTVDTEKQQTILFSIETVVQGICAKDGRLFSQRRLFQIMNDRLFGTQTIESQSRSNFVRFFSFLLYCWTFRRNYPSGLSVCCLCVCVALEVGEWILLLSTLCAIHFGVDCRKWATLWSVVLLAMDKCWPTGFFFSLFFRFFAFHFHVLWCFVVAREFCVGRKKKKKVSVHFSFGRRVQHDERERERNLSSSNQLE